MARERLGTGTSPCPSVSCTSIEADATVQIEYKPRSGGSSLRTPGRLLSPRMSSRSRCFTRPSLFTPSLPETLGREMSLDGDGMDWRHREREDRRRDSDVVEIKRVRGRMGSRDARRTRDEEGDDGASDGYGAANRHQG